MPHLRAALLLLTRHISPCIGGMFATPRRSRLIASTLSRTVIGPQYCWPFQWSRAAFHCISITAWARTGNVPIPAIFGGAAKNMKPSLGRLSRLVMCSTMGMPASSSVE
jgi:hypothetical protein